MVDILHKVGIRASAADTYQALTTIDGLAGWWTDDTHGETAVGDVIAFRFGTGGGFDMKIVDLQPDVRVVWEVVDGPEEWLGTVISFDLLPDEGYTIVMFRHAGWAAPVPFMHHCSTKWGVFLMSLKSWLETGTGAAYPNDQKIDRWEAEGMPA